jgi:hypothetical protein
VIAAVDGVEHFIGFLEHKGSQSFERLLAIPRASVRASQSAHDVHELLERESGRAGARARLGVARGDTRA